MQSYLFDVIGVIFLSLSVLLYFAFYAVFSLPTFKINDLLGTFGPAMGDSNTYFGFLLLIGTLYLCEKIAFIISNILKPSEKKDFYNIIHPESISCHFGIN